jgi:hypothetical protein
LGSVTRGAKAALDGQIATDTTTIFFLFAFCQTASSSSTTSSYSANDVDVFVGRAIAARLGRFIGHFHEVAIISRGFTSDINSVTGRSDDE